MKWIEKWIAVLIGEIGSVADVTKIFHNNLLFPLTTAMNVSQSTQDSDSPAAHGMKTTEAVDTAEKSAYITFV
jgi:hypothetical protein